MIAWLMKLFRADTNYQQRQIEKYLANSTDLVDLERRQRELTHGRFKL